MFSKKINILFCAIALVAFSCTPLEDTFNELDSKIDKNAISDIKSQVEKVMSADDYAEISKLFAKSKDSTTTKNIAKYKNFGSDDLAKKFVPALLKKQYGHLGNGSAVNVTYKLYDPIRSSSAKNYTLVKADYDAIGGNAKKYGNISNSPKDLLDFASIKYPSAKNGDSYNLTYKIYKSGKVITETSIIIKLKSKWMSPMVWSNYEKLGGLKSRDNATKGQYFFKSSTTAKRNIGINLKELKPFAKEDDKVLVQFAYSKDKGKTISKRYAYYSYDGAKWNEVEDAVDKKLQFGLEKNVWVPDNTIKFTFSATDFTFISKQTSLHIKGALESAGNYKNFDRRSDKTNYWSDEKILKAVNLLLKDKYKSAKEGQKFEVSYAIYNGAAGVETIKVILKGKDYVKQK